MTESIGPMCHSFW